MTPGSFLSIRVVLQETSAKYIPIRVTGRLGKIAQLLGKVAKTVAKTSSMKPKY
jgi:hypothetical protein